MSSKTTSTVQYITGIGIPFFNWLEGFPQSSEIYSYESDDLRSTNRNLRKRITWKTVTVAHKKLLKFILVHLHSFNGSRISSQVQSPLPSGLMQNFPPKRNMPRTLKNIQHSSIYAHNTNCAFNIIIDTVVQVVFHILGIT